MKSYDAIVIGAGINGMVAAAELAGAGWSVALVDEHERIGGFIASGEVTEPGFVHDTFSSWHPLFVAGGAYAVLGADLHRCGLTYRNADHAVTASVSERGVVIADRDPEVTAGTFEQPGDRAAYRAMLAELEQRAPFIFGALGSELRGRDLMKLGATVARQLGRSGANDLMRTTLQSGRAFSRERFTGWEVDQLWSPWLLHAGLAPDHASGGQMFPVMAFTMHAIGLPVVEGGASNFVAAFEGLLAERGVDLILGAAAESIETQGDRAVAVHVGGTRLGANRAVIASTSTPRLYRDLLAQPGGKGQAAAARHRPGRAAMQVHVALNRPAAWGDTRLADVPLIHISNGSDSTGIACAQAEAGLLPSEPTVVVGQQYLLDPTRVPDGKATLWLQLQEVPYAPRGDAAAQIDTTGGWTEGVVSAYVDRVLTRIEQYAPGLRDDIASIKTISPTDLQAANPNAINADPYGGAAEIDQSMIWRPGTGSGHATEIEGLWHIGAFTHPGPGLGGGSGHLVAQALTAPPATDHIRQRLRGRLNRSATSS